jgi:hypothetical protein
MKLVEIIKMFLSETCAKVHVGKNLLDAFPVQNGLEQGDAFHLCFRICYQEGARKSGRIGIEWNTSTPVPMLMMKIIYLAKI